MIKPREVKYIQNTLLKWYSKNKRDFPWRRDGCSNYNLILSEILLQRTKAESVAKYYKIFFSRYPSWSELSITTYEQLVVLLEPIGLQKQRASRILKVVKELNKRNGNLPTSRKDLHECNLGSLYISNAFEVFVLNKHSPLLDVNMARILVRYFGLTPKSDIRNDKMLQEVANMVIHVSEFKELNWAFLDFAALVCRSKKPHCNDCKLKKFCKFQSLNRSLIQDKTTLSSI